MKVHRQLFLSLDESEQYNAPYGKKGRQFRVQQVYATLNSEGQVGHIQESGPLILLRGGLSVDEYGCTRFPELADLPEPVRRAIEP